MKKIIPFALLLFSFIDSNAQELERNKSVLGFHLGNSLTARFYLTNPDTDSWEPEVDKSVVTQLTYDYLVKKRFSIGATVAYQSINLTLRDTLTERTLEEGKVDRVYIGARGLWHYGGSPKWDLYSGIKFGMILYSPSGIKKNHTEKSIIADKHTVSAPRAGLIPFGCRYFISENMALGAQISLGVPTFTTFNFNYAF